MSTKTNRGHTFVASCPYTRAYRKKPDLAPPARPRPCPRSRRSPPPFGTTKTPRPGCPPPVCGEKPYTPRQIVAASSLRCASPPPAPARPRPPVCRPRRPPRPPRSPPTPAGCPPRARPAAVAAQAPRRAPVARLCDTPATTPCANVSPSARRPSRWPSPRGKKPAPNTAAPPARRNACRRPVAHRRAPSATAAPAAPRAPSRKKADQTSRLSRFPPMKFGMGKGYQIPVSHTVATAPPSRVNFRQIRGPGGSPQKQITAVRLGSCFHRTDYCEEEPI